MTLYENIKARRIELNMSQKELADKLGYKSTSTIAKIESGKNDIPQSKIVAFAKALDTTPGKLMGIPTVERIPNFIKLDTSKLDKAIKRYAESNSQNISLTPRDERQIAEDLERMITDLDTQNTLAAMGGTIEDQEDRELLKASLLTSMRLAKKLAKEKYTPKKYRKEQE